MTTSADGVDRLGLVGPERLGRDPFGQPLGQRVPRVEVALGARGEVLDVDQSAVRGELVEECFERRWRVGRERHGPMLRPPCDRMTSMWSGTVRGVDIVVHAHTEGRWSILTVAGELDVVGAPELRQQVMRAVAEGQHDLVLDLSGVDFIDSFGLGVLIGALKRVRLLDGELQLVVTEPRVRRVLELCDLDRVFTLHTDVRAAVS